MWSETGSEDMNSEQDDCCSEGHRPSLLLRTGPGGRICLLCVSNLISDKDAFLIHRTYAVEELSMALDDDVFSRALVNGHPKILVASLANAISSSMDQRFCRGIMEVIVSLCRLSRDTDESLVEIFLRQTARQLGSPSLWSPSKSLPLRLIGLLLELHCQQELCLPQAIRNQKDFVTDLVVALQLPGTVSQVLAAPRIFILQHVSSCSLTWTQLEFSEALQEEIFYIFHKLASLEGGVEQFRHYSGRLCHAAVHALLKTESDSLRINCIALLSVMASRSVFDISFGGGSVACRDGKVHSSRESVVNGDLSFMTAFAEAMKASLLSSDLQVQASALQLICLVFPEGARFDTRLPNFVEGGIVDYVFEIIRLSENHESIQELAIDVLILFSAEGSNFPHRLKCGLDTVIRVLAKSIDTYSIKLQTSILQLLSRSLADVTQTLSTPRTEELVLLLTKILENHAKAVTVTADTRILPPTFNLACLALISLTEAPGCAAIANVHRILQKATESAVMAASSAAKVNPRSSNLKHATYLLQEVYKTQFVENDAADNITEPLTRLCELYLLPAFTDNPEKFNDEILLLTFLNTFTLILKAGVLETTNRFASKLTSNRCFTLTFELMGRFPVIDVKDSAYKFLGALVDKLSGFSIEACIEQSINYLPSDPSDLLLLLEQRSVENQQLLSAHHACIAILSTSYSSNDRLAKETDILASLEQHVLINHGSALAPGAILRQFVSLYASAKDALEDLDAAWSAEAEKILDLVIRNSNCSDLLSSETPMHVLRWFLRKESMNDVNTVQLLTWFTTVVNKCSGDAPQKMDISVLSSKYSEEEPSSQFLATLAKLVGDEDCGTSLLVSLFDNLVAQGVDDAISIVAQAFLHLARMSVLVGQQLVQHGLISTLQQLICNYNLKATDSTLTSCLELLFQLLYDADPSREVMANRSWLDIAKECASLVMRTKSSYTTFEVVAPLSVINLILQKSYENDFFAPACEVLVCNRDLCGKLEATILDAESKGMELSQIDSTSVNGVLLCAAVIFTLLRLRCALHFEPQIVDNLAHEKQYIGFKTSLHGDWDANGSKFSRTSLTCEHWCRILYFGPPSLKTLACCCLLEIFSQLPDTSDLMMNNSLRFKECDMPCSFFTAVTMVLQGSILGESERIRKIASYCLIRLLHSNLSLEQKKAVASSPWNHMLLENLATSLSTAHFKQNPETARSPASFSAAYVAVGLLQMSSPQSYLSGPFSHSSITKMISKLCEDDISPIIVSLFYELLLSKYLTFEHVRILRELFQVSSTVTPTSIAMSNTIRSSHSRAQTQSLTVINILDIFQETRRRSYGRGFSLRLGNRKFSDCSKILKVYHSTDHVIYSAILDLAITARDEVLEVFSNDTNSGAVTSLLDSFMRDSYLQFK